MIRINLLPVKRKKKVQPLPAIFIQSGIIAVVVILFLVVYTFHLSGKVSDMKEEKANKERRLDELKVKLKEVENYENDNNLYRKKGEIIEQLKKNQSVPLNLLEEVSAQLTKGVWLSSLDDKGGAVDIDGYAFTNSELVGYIQNLKNSKYLTDVALLESRQVVFEGVPVYQFKLTFKVKV